MSKIINVDIKKFSYSKETILKDITFSVNKGEFIVITGLSGCGKTSLLRLLNGLIPALYDGNIIGQISILDKSILDYKAGEIAKYVGNVFQNPNDQFFSKDVENEVALIGENMGMERNLLRRQVQNSLKEIGISDLKTRKVRELSGGQKQKVAIASTLVFDSEIILLDEPSANLDYTSTNELGRILKHLKDCGKTIIIVEHRLSYLFQLIDRMIVLKEGKIEGIFSSKDLTSDLEQKNELRSFDNNNLKSVMEYPDDNQMIRIEDVHIINKGYSLKEPVNFTLNSGECMALIGDNGIGKTTLAKQLSGIIPLKKGKTSYSRSIKERLCDVAISLQNCSNMFFYETVEKELIPKDKVKDGKYLEEVKRYLLEMDLWNKRMLNPHDLSGGEKQRLAVIIALLKNSKLVILDEPTAGLDYRRMKLVADAVREKIKNTPVILITHDIELIFKVCNTAYLLSKNGNKKIIIRGNEDKILDFFKKEK